MPYEQDLSCDMTNKSAATANGETKKDGDTPASMKGGSHVNSISPPSLYCIEVPHQRQPCDDDGPFVAITWVNVLKEVRITSK